tara:strand:+ start:178 stop:1320 length:1143 start_codon:yes stop_codon:yes gene_type:complete
MKNLLLILFFIPLLAFSDGEKRLALVIGNSNYEKAPLNNPVNDALLMAKTLEDLDFDVILDTNISNRGEFIKTIREFGYKRPNYDVGFVYYAGHGIQVGAENFLLPTNENFETENDVIDFGVSVQSIMRYLTSMTNQVNILILDACRNNPYEGNWKKTRNLQGAGLAKIKPPTGSLIAFSTDVGNTAADGDGKNSIYCLALSKYLYLPNITINGIFNNVRTSVKTASNGQQIPVEMSKLEGGDFYFIKSNEINNSNINRFLIEDYLKDYYSSIENNNLSDLKNFYKDTVEYFFSKHEILATEIIELSKRQAIKYSSKEHNILWNTLKIQNTNDNKIYISYDMKYSTTTKKSSEKKENNLRLFVKLQTEPLKIYSIYEVFF